VECDPLMVEACREELDGLEISLPVDYFSLADPLEPYV